jgi:hypothetical protein
MGWSVRRPARPYKVGLSGSPVAWAARGLGHSRRLARARGAGRGQRRRPPGPIPFQLLHLFCSSTTYLHSPLPPPTGLLRARGPLLAAGGRAPANWSLPRRAPPASIDPSACVSLWVSVYGARAPRLHRPRCLCVCLSVYIYIYICMCMAPVGHADLDRCRCPGGCM